MRNVTVLLFLLFSFAAKANECPLLSGVLNELIKFKVNELNGAEDCSFRKIYKSDAIELSTFTVEGPCYEVTELTPGSCGNAYFIFIAGVVDGVALSPLQIGGKGLFHSDSISVLERHITISGNGYAPTDPLCCPSVPEKRQMQIMNGQLVLVSEK